MRALDDSSGPMPRTPKKPSRREPLTTVATVREGLACAGEPLSLNYLPHDARTFSVVRRLRRTRKGYYNMFMRLTLLGSLALVFFAGQTALTRAQVHSVTTQHPITVHDGLKLCLAPPRHNRLVTIVGYFRSDPVLTNGPTMVRGALFDSNYVPDDAASQVRTYRGIFFAVTNFSSLARDRATLRIVRPSARLSVRGILACGAIVSLTNVTSISSTKHL